MSEYEYSFDPNEPNNTAASIYRLVRAGGPRILDLGSGPAIVSSYLTKHDAKVVTCIDSSAESLETARRKGVARTIEADLGASVWRQQLDGERFDVIVMADVLEHLVDPRLVLEAIANDELLTDDGYLVISIPNAGHEAVLAELIRGRFTYQESGLLDSTHLRFFTLASLRELLEPSGFFITQVERTHRTAEQTSLAVRDVTLPPELRDRLLEASPEAQTYQFIVRGERADASRELAQVREELASANAAAAERQRVSARDVAEALATERDAAIEEAAALRKARMTWDTEMAEVRRDNTGLEQRLAEMDAALSRERKLTATERKRYERLVASATAAANDKELDAARRDIARLEKKLADVYGSRTWKVGRAAWSAFHIPAQLLRKTGRSPQNASTTPAAAPESVIKPSDYTLVENTVVKQKYEQAVARRAFSGDGRNVAIAVFTTDLAEGRGDVYTAIGLGRRLEDIGYEVIYLPRDRWYDPPAGTDIYVAMLETVDVTRLVADVTTVAWVRNQTAVWAEQPWLALYDLVLASSQGSLDALEAVYPGPLGLLSIGVDTELFTAHTRPEDRRGVVTTVNQWGREREVFAHLKERTPEFPLALYGHQRGIAPELAPYANGSVSFFALPSLYNQARIVLDDFNHTTAGYGNVNSRLFEAAVCGATVMTNRSSGLAALGLGDIPVFTSAGELFELIARDLESADAAKSAEALGRRVAERHSYQQRAADFDAHIKQLAERRPATASDGVVISFYPDYRDNPYLEMMWSELRNNRSIAIPVGNSLNFTATVQAAEHRRTVFHLNWTAPILGDATDDRDRVVRYRRFLEAIDEMHSNGIPSIWTVHNVLPHECADPELEAQLRQEIADRMDLIHVMCEDTGAACSEWFQIPQSKVRVIPHPSYIDVYPNLIDKSAARSELGLQPDDHVYLHFGQIRPYKGIDRLLDAFDLVSRHDPAARLLLVGKSGRFEGIHQIIDRARANPNVIGNFNSVPDANVQLYMNAADVVVLPHQTALNSGALLLAYSFGRPVIAAETGCMTGLVDELTGVTFNWDDGSQALLNALLAARELGPDHGRAAHERAQELHYLKIGKQFSEMVDELLD